MIKDKPAQAEIILPLHLQHLRAGNPNTVALYDHLDQEVLECAAFKALQGHQFNEKMLTVTGGKKYYQQQALGLIVVMTLTLFGIGLSFMGIIYPKPAEWLFSMFMAVIFVLSVIGATTHWKAELDTEISWENYADLNAISELHQPTRQYVQQKLEANEKITIRDLHYLGFWKLCDQVTEIENLQKNIEQRNKFKKQNQGLSNVSN